MVSDEPGAEELVVTRRWTAGGENTTLKVVKGGFKAEKGQTALDAMIGAMAFDPLAWLRQPVKDQRAMLLDVVDLPFDLAELDAERARIFDERTVVNRDVSTMEARVAGMIEPPDGTPDAEVSMAELLAEIEQARATAAHVEALFEESRAADDHVVACEREIERLKALVADAEAQLDEAKTDARRAGEAADTAPLVIDNDAQLPIVTVLTEKLGTLEATNVDVRAKLARDAAVAELARVTRDAERLTSELTAIERRRVTTTSAVSAPSRTGRGLSARALRPPRASQMASSVELLPWPLRPVMSTVLAPASGRMLMWWMPLTSVTLSSEMRMVRPPGR